MSVRQLALSMMHTGYGTSFATATLIVILLAPIPAVAGPDLVPGCGPLKEFACTPTRWGMYLGGAIGLLVSTPVVLPVWFTERSLGRDHRLSGDIATYPFAAGFFAGAAAIGGPFIVIEGLVYHFPAFLYSRLVADRPNEPLQRTGQ